MYLFGETQLLLEDNLRAVVEDAFAGRVAEHLVRNHAHDLEVEGFVAVDERLEGAVQPAVVGHDLPLGHELRIARIVAGDEKPGAADLVRLAAVEQHILARGGRVAEAVAEVPSERGAVLEARLQTAPIPSVVERPHAASPIESGERCFRIEFLHAVADGEAALRAHAVYLLVVVEVPRLVKRRGDDHALLREIRKSDVEADVVALLVRVVESAEQAAGFAVAGEGHLRLAVPPMHVAVLRRARHIEPAHGEKKYRTVGELRRRDEIHNGDRKRADIAHIRDGQTQCVLVAADVVVIPLLDARFGRGNVLAVVVPQQFFCVSGVDNVTVPAQQRLSLSDFLLHNVPSRAE